MISWSLTFWLFLFCLFVLYFCIIVLILRRGVHISKKCLYALLSFIQERHFRGKCETAWGSQKWLTSVRQIRLSLLHQQKWKRQFCPEMFSEPATYYSLILFQIYTPATARLSLFQKSNSQNQMDYSSVLSLAQPQLPLPFPPPPPPWVLTASAEHHRSNEIGLCILWKSSLPFF